MDELFTMEFMAKILEQNKRIQPTWKVRIVLAENFDPAVVKFSEPVPACDKYVIYEFVTDTQQEALFRLFHCKFGDSCSRLYHSLYKFFDHLRTHTRERPFICHCGIAFAQRTNLMKHVEHVHEQK
jgi:hypothetical protein